MNAGEGTTPPLGRIPMSKCRDRRVPFAKHTVIITGQESSMAAKMSEPEWNEKQYLHSLHVFPPKIVFITKRDKNCSYPVEEAGRQRLSPVAKVNISCNETYRGTCLLTSQPKSSASLWQHPYPSA